MANDDTEALATSALTQIGTVLADKVHGLAGKVDENNQAVAANSRKVDENTRKTRIKIRWLIGLVILDLVLSAAVFWSYITIRRVVNDALCPMFSIFVGSYDPESRAPGPGRDVYEDNFRKIRVIYYDVLTCSQPPSGPNRYLPQPGTEPSKSANP